MQRAWVVVIAVLGLLAASCGGDDGDEAGGGALTGTLTETVDLTDTVGGQPPLDFRSRLATDALFTYPAPLVRDNVDGSVAVVWSPTGCPAEVDVDAPIVDARMYVTVTYPVPADVACPAVLHESRLRLNQGALQYAVLVDETVSVLDWFVEPAESDTAPDGGPVAFSGTTIEVFWTGGCLPTAHLRDTGGVPTLTVDPGYYLGCEGTGPQRLVIETSEETRPDVVVVPPGPA